MNIQPIKSVWKQLPSGLACCCGLAGCKGTLARLRGEFLEMPKGFQLQKTGVWDLTKRSAARYSAGSKLAKRDMPTYRDLKRLQKLESTKKWMEESVFIDDAELEAETRNYSKQKAEITARLGGNADSRLQDLPPDFDEKFCSARNRSPDTGEMISIDILPLVIRCPACKRTGIIYGTEARLAATA